MPLNPYEPLADVVRVSDLDFPEEWFAQAVHTALHVSGHVRDRPDLHARDRLERFINVLTGEIAELAVLRYFQLCGRRAESAVDKASPHPDAGHDLYLWRRDGSRASCSVKSSLAYKLDLPGVLRQSRPAFKQREVRDVNVQVYFLYRLDVPPGEPRLLVPALAETYLISWFRRDDLLGGSFGRYAHERREVADCRLLDARPLRELLPGMAPAGVPEA